ncbi:MAG TPA: small multi-drug export protein [Candidatus Nanoarchaeia archaeon]|nr:small multi-drug export protein [Candidatus Nanoarchaeia archaeon]
MDGLLEVIILSVLPISELRGGIPLAILRYKMSWPLAFVICVLANFLVGPIVYFFLDKVMHIFRRVKWIDKLYKYYVERTQKKIHRSVEKYGEWALALFIGIPLPATGVYSGMLAAYVMGLDFKKSMIAAALGVIISGAIVTAVVMTGAGALSFLMKA